MRILKDIQDIFNVIAGEMINIESHRLQYIDGQRIAPDPHSTDYPVLHDDNISWGCRGAFGYIFLPEGYPKNKFESEIISCIQLLEKELYDIDRPDELKRYHTYNMSYHTNIRVKSSQNRTLSHSAQHPPPYKNIKYQNILREFTSSLDESSRNARFTWIIKNISAFEGEITSRNISNAAAQYIFSIFYDKDNVCTLRHNDITFEFSQKLLVGWSNVVDERIDVFKHGHSLQFELSNSWCYTGMHRGSAPLKLRELTKDVYKIDYKKLHFKHTLLTDGNASSMTPGICSECESKLWGDNYVLAGHINNIDDIYNVPICPICLHNDPSEQPIENSFFRLFSTTFPCTAEDMIESPKYSSTKKDILREALRGVVIKEIKILDYLVTYLYIGDKYLAFIEYDKYLFSGILSHPDFINKKICSAKILG